MYHTDDFLLSYEAYHLSTIEAHQAQAKPSRELPVIGGASDGHQRVGAAAGAPVPRRRGG